MLAFCVAAQIAAPGSFALVQTVLAHFPLSLRGLQAGHRKFQIKGLIEMGDALADGQQCSAESCLALTINDFKMQLTFLHGLSNEIVHRLTHMLTIAL